jgi:NADH pyrophosphatase NudC (nudix superfamily)
MDIGSIFLIFALFILVAWYVSRPLLDRRPVARKAITTSQAEHNLSTLLAERDRVVRLLQELDFDFTLGKIPEQDYPNQRNLLLQRGADVLSQLDALQPSVKTELAADRLEKAIAARRAQQARPATTPRKNGNGASVPDDELERLIASRRREHPEKTAGFCPKCGKPIQKSDHFCPKCGAKV